MNFLSKLGIAIAMGILLVACYARVGGDRMLNPPAAPVVLIPPVTITAPYQCQEDDECWDCQSMGNQTCGEVKP